MSEYLDLGTGIVYLSACLETRTANEDRDAVRAFSLGSGTVAPVSLGGTSQEILRATCGELKPVIAVPVLGIGGLSSVALWNS